MRDYAELKRRAEASVGFDDIPLAPDVILELIAENERLRAGMKGDYDLNAWLDWTREAEGLRLRCERLEADKQSMAETHALYTWLRKKCDQPSNGFVAVQMNIGHDWVPVHDIDRDLRSMIEREEP